MEFSVRGGPFITFAPRGGGGVKEVANFANDKTDRLRETANKGGEGVQNPENSANVINGCPLNIPTVIFNHGLELYGIKATLKSEHH